MKTAKHILLTIAFFICTTAAFAQSTPPPPPDGHGGDTNQPAGGGAPIGSGLGILLALGAAYGGKKVWDYRKRQEE